MTIAPPESKPLDSLLAHRPDAQELVNKNILKDPKVAPAIQQQRDELSKRKIEDSLRHKINHRPTAEELIEHNILKSDPGKVAPALQRSQLELEKSRLQDKLQQRISERPDLAKLVEQGILKESDLE
ncbi:uncharacterized protein BYT42DRAFT_615491 [Radiomyces spectabilis]|uniref:uncharacterized protein n=1 Tax=Radiomyces spectabilis TaxID=64574 RepID=UPI002220C33D|nr:uncharacterized protein BYT42DRAFT_615491 [Radiomyces spectabilis]KAI8374317.1 hypothetical protein BYT42DRAFT_615491 [Radiomyces spectabilis]